MPTSLFSDVDGGGTNLQDPRFLQLALEMSMLGLNESEELSTFDSDERNTKGQNMTECVPVPSSEHVAEIVGRQGCKIKALRAKTNTYIKTPVRGEEPVFVVTGRKEDVTLAKKEIISAAEHFSQIRASRKNNMNGSTAPGPPNNIPGQITLQVRVPYRVVGLVVGPKGATIKRIQQQTNTYIVTPSREKLPVFEVTGLPDDVEIAKQEIEIHINARTGGQLDDDQNDFHTNGVDHSFNVLVDDDLNSVFKSRQNVLNSFNSALSSYCDNGKILSSRDSSSSFPFSSTSASTDLTSQFFPNNFQIYDSVEKRVSQSPPFNPAVAPPPTSSVWPDLRNSAYNLGTQPNGFSKRSYSISGPSTASRLSPSLADFTAGFLNNPQARRMCSDPVLSSSILPTSNGEAFDTSSALTSSSLLKLFNSMSTANNGISSAAGSTSSSPTNSIGSAGPKEKRECLLCYESDVVAAFVPCGHNFFCMECATRVCGSENPVCPACNQPVDHAMRIYG